MFAYIYIYISCLYLYISLSRVNICVCVRICRHTSVAEIMHIHILYVLPLYFCHRSKTRCSWPETRDIHPYTYFAIQVKNTVFLACSKLFFTHKFDSALPGDSTDHLARLLGPAPAVAQSFQQSLGLRVLLAKTHFWNHF